MRIEIDAELTLSPIERSDSHRLVELLHDPEIYRWTLRIPYPYRSEHAAAWLEIVEKQLAATSIVANFAIRHHQLGLVGGCAFEGLTGEGDYRAEIGYWLGKPYWGRGWMTRTVRRLCRYGFENLSLKRITAMIFDGNAASVRVAEKVGFAREGRMRRHYWKDGKPIDSLVYGLLPEDLSPTH